MTRAQGPDDWLSRAPDLSDGSPVPAHQRIAGWLTAEVGRGALAAGRRLPREDDFAALLGVSRMTLRQALATLEARGVLLRRPGRGGGTVVAEPRFDADLTGLTGLTEQLRRSHVRAGARVVSAGTVSADRRLAAALDLEPGSPVHHVVRVRTALREPVALESSWFPADALPGLLDHPLAGSLYRLLDVHYGRAPHTADERLTAVAADAEQAGLLAVAVAAPLLQVERLVRDASGLAVEHAVDLFRPDRVTVTLRTQVGGEASVVTRGRGHRTGRTGPSSTP